MSGEFRIQERKTGRGERLSPDRNDILGTVRVASQIEIDRAAHVA
jgi:hypothetical protein